MKLIRFYGITDKHTLEFFTAHQAYDVEHAKQISILIEQYVRPQQAIKATREATNALWNFLNGMCRIGNIQCHNVVDVSEIH